MKLLLFANYYLTFTIILFLLFERDYYLNKRLLFGHTIIQYEAYETSVLDESTPKSSVKINNSKIDESPLSNISSYRRDLFKDLEISSEFSLDEENTLVDQSDFVFSPEIKVNKVINRVGRPKNSKKKLGFFKLINIKEA